MAIAFLHARLQPKQKVMTMAPCFAGQDPGRQIYLGILAQLPLQGLKWHHDKNRWHSQHTSLKSLWKFETIASTFALLCSCNFCLTMYRTLQIFAASLWCWPKKSAQALDAAKVAFCGTRCLWKAPGIASHQTLACAQPPSLAVIHLLAFSRGWGTDVWMYDVGYLHGIPCFRFDVGFLSIGECEFAKQSISISFQAGHGL